MRYLLIGVEDSRTTELDELLKPIRDAIFRGADDVIWTRDAGVIVTAIAPTGEARVEAHLDRILTAAARLKERLSPHVPAATATAALTDAVIIEREALDLLFYLRAKAHDR
jgi:hypothetical protein